MSALEQLSVLMQSHHMLASGSSAFRANATLHGSLTLRRGQSAHEVLFSKSLAGPARQLRSRAFTQSLPHT